MATSSPIDLRLPQTPRLAVSGNEAVHGEFQLVYNAVFALWDALTRYIESGGGGGEGEGKWGSITGNIEDQTDLWTALSNINSNLNTINQRIQGLSNNIAALQTALSETNTVVNALTVRVNANELGIQSLTAQLATVNQSLAAINTRMAAIELSLESKIGDAPRDGKEYVRKNSTWVEATQSGGGGDAKFPIVTGEVPPVLVYLDDGNLVWGAL